MQQVGTIAGPLFIKIDTGPGRLSKELLHVKFMDKIYNKGVDIGHGHPNGTEATQEMDQGYFEFKPACNKSTIQVAAMKMALWVKAQKIMRKKQATSTSKQSATAMTDMEAFLQDGSESNDKGYKDVADDVEKEQYTFTVKGSISCVKLDNGNLCGVVNGFPGDPIALRPFDCYFSCANIWKWWCNVGFMPMTRNALNN